MGYVKGLKCRECEQHYPIAPRSVCEFCFGPLEVDYDYDALQRVVSPKLFESRPATMWRYKELLPFEGEVTVGLPGPGGPLPGQGFHVGYTPLVKAPRLAEALGAREVYIKNDAVNFPTLSFKDRVVSVAISKAIELGFTVVGCASTGNLANAVAAQAAAAGLESYIFIPHDLEEAKVIGTTCYGAHLVKIRGNYDDVNRLCSEIADEHHWAFVNINLRPYYAEGSKTMGYEIAEQLGWRIPQNVVVPMAGGSLITKIAKAFEELRRLELVEKTRCRLYGAQATGCAPITTAVKSESIDVQPVKPKTIAKSLAIGNPADGYYAARTILQSGGWGEDVTDEEILEGIELLAKTEGIFTETAGGVTVGVAKKLLQQRKLNRNESIVLCITGNGLKTQEVLRRRGPKIPVIEPRLEEFRKLL